jgi:hypothetical protein
MPVKANPEPEVMILPNLSVNLIRPAGQPPGNSPAVQSARISAVGLSFQSRQEQSRVLLPSGMIQWFVAVLL